MQCLLDMDGVIVNFYRSYVALQELPWPWDDPKNLGIFHVKDWKPNGFHAKPWSEDFWINLPWMEDGQEILSMCEKTFGQQNICLLTNHTGCSLSASGKIKWVEKHLPQYSSQLLLGQNKNFASNYNRILIDDYDLNIKNYNGPTLLVPRPWNSRHHITTVPFMELALYALRMYGLR